MSESTKTIKELDAEAKRIIVAAKAVIEDSENQTPDAVDAAVKSLGDAEKIVERLDRVRGENHGNALKSINRIENSIAVLHQPDRPFLGGANTDGSRLTRDGDGSFKSLGRQLVEDEGYRAWLKSQFPGSHVPDGAKIQTPAFALKSLITLAGDNTAGRPLSGLAERRPELVMLGWNRLVLSDLITTIPTDKDLIEVAREKSRTNNADVVGEATDVSGSSGVKPQSILDWELIQVTVKNIAHWVATSTRALTELRRLQAEVDTFLREGIRQRQEDLVLNGNPSTDPNQFTGVYNTTGILTQAYATSILATSRKARTKIMVDGKAMPTAYLMHPTDWEAFDLIQDAEERYYFGGPMAMGTPRLWGLPVVESEYATTGLAILAAWIDAVLYDREETTVQAFNQHADFAIRNLVALLGEKRAAFHVRRPRSFVTVDLAA